MRRIGAQYANAGQTLAREVYDSQGYSILDRGTVLTADSLKTLKVHNVGEVLVGDERLDDVIVWSMFSPSLEGRASQALKQIVDEAREGGQIEEALIFDLTDPVFSLMRELLPQPLGELNPLGARAVDEFYHSHPVKTAQLAMLLGRLAGYKATELSSLGLAATLMNLGAIAYPEAESGRLDIMVDDPTEAVRAHPVKSAEMLSPLDYFDQTVLDAVSQHHERWDGGGYPYGLSGEEISREARIISVADAYFELVSAHEDRQPFMPHEAIEYIMASSGELFDPEFVRLLARSIPLYPTGVMVALNTGEAGLIADGNPGHIGRPVVRVCYDTDGASVRQTYDLNLSESDNQGRLVVKILEY